MNVGSRVVVLTAGFLLAAVFASGLAQDPNRQSPGIGGVDQPILTSVPRTMTYQGILKDVNGDPVPNTDIDITFRIFNAPSGGSALWSHVVGISTDNAGYFSASLTDLNLPFNVDYYLELQAAGEPSPMSPRQKLAMSAYAARVDTSQYSVVGGGWFDAGSDIRLDNANDDVGIGISSPTAKLDVGDVARVQGLNYPDFPTTGAGLELAYRPSDNTGIVQAYNRDAAEWGDLYLGSGNVGIATSTPAAKLHVAGDVQVTGAMTTPFPRPAYNSGWFPLEPGQDTTLVHNLGGSSSDYFIDFQMRKADNTISNYCDGGDWHTVLSLPAHWGARYEGLTNSQIVAHRHAEDGSYLNFRVRIWVIE